MSLFGSLYTAVSGLTAQSAAFGNISDNVANSQTVGFKGTDTTFQDYLTTSNSTVNDPGAVGTTPQYTNDVQGTVTQSTDPLALAISGQGFFAVQEAQGSGSTGAPDLSPQQYYTRTGDFTMSKNGYLVNSAGEYLQGWTVNPATGQPDQTKLSAIQVSEDQFAPVPTSKINLSANLPATPTAGSTDSSQIQVFDSLGTPHVVTVNWTQNAASDWTATLTAPDNAGGATIGSAEVKFGANNNNVADGTIGAFGTTSGSVTTTPYAAGSDASINFTANFGNGAQTIALDLGPFGGTTGVTQFAGTTYDQRSATQDGVASGAFSSVTTDTNGNIIANYDNGQQRTIAQVPIVTFTSPDQLQRQNGEAFTADPAAGTANAQYANSNNAGQLVTSSVESSNVDIATEFSKLIIAQQAYGANAKVVTSAQQLLQETIDMKQ